MIRAKYLLHVNSKIKIEWRKTEFAEAKDNDINVPWWGRITQCARTHSKDGTVRSPVNVKQYVMHFGSAEGGAPVQV